MADILRSVVRGPAGPLRAASVVRVYWLRGVLEQAQSTPRGAQPVVAEALGRHPTGVRRRAADVVDDDVRGLGTRCGIDDPDGMEVLEVPRRRTAHPVL